MKIVKKFSFFGTVLLIAGTAIGAGMLALPVSTSQYGFFPSAMLFIVSWIFMTFAALLLLEVNLRLPEHSNIISMAKQTLGKPGTIVAWLSYLLLLYALLSAYLSGLGALLQDILITRLHIALPMWSSVLMMAILGAALIYFGVRSIDLLNRVLMTGLIITFIIMISGLIPHTNTQVLHYSQMQGVWHILPIVFTTFGYQIIIPSLRGYLNNETVKLRHAIIIGGLIPLIIYLIWEFLILTVLPTEGALGLKAIFQSGQPEIGLTRALAATLQIPWITWGFRSFATFAIATSFLGVALSLFDFLHDGLKTRKHHLHDRIKILFITFLPPFFFATLFPRAFIRALEYGGIFVAILLVLLPALMAWSSRYQKTFLPAAKYQVRGGKLALIALMLFALFVVAVELKII